MLLNNIKYARCRFPNAEFISTFTVSRINYVDMVSFVDFAKAYGFNKVVFNPMQQWTHGELVSNLGVESIMDSNDYMNKRNELLGLVDTKSIVVEVNI